MLQCSMEQAVDQVLERIEGPIRLGLPLGLGKPNRFVNALYRRIKQQPQRSLTLYTALSLGRPAPGGELERRFSGPFLARVYGDYPELDYLRDLHRGSLPANVRLEEFYLQPGDLLDNPLAQQRYVSLNYSQVARELNRKGINVLAQLVASDPERPEWLSLSCNPDVTLDLLPLLAARRAAGESILCIAQPHGDLPYLGGDAELPREAFDLLIDAPECSTLFSLPSQPISAQDQAIGLYASSLVRDGGTLQVGIGALGDALVAALLARQRENDDYRALLTLMGLPQHWGTLVFEEGGLGVFREGLYACSEMFVVGLLLLIDAGVVRRPVYADARLQGLANDNVLDAGGRPRSLAMLIDPGGLPARLQQSDLDWLQRHGLLSPEIRLEDGTLRLPDGWHVTADLRDPDTAAALEAHLGPARGGVLLHGGFILGPQEFYQRLSLLSPQQRQRIGMTGIGFINRLYGDEELKRLQRRDARFVNSVIGMTLLGAGVADQLEDGRVISGVGGQQDFVAQAHELEGARSILLLRSWREVAGVPQSNLFWRYAHATIARHQRDLVVTEYGIADLRGKSDAEVIAALLQIADSRFQPELIQEAQRAGKLPADFQLAAEYRQNTPERLLAWQTRYPQLFTEYPLGCDFSREERDLLRALRWLKGRLRPRALPSLGRKLLFGQPASGCYLKHLQRMDLSRPEGAREWLYRRLLLAGLKASVDVEAGCGAGAHPLSRLIRPGARPARR